MASRAQSERERLQRDIANAQERLKAAEAERQEVDSRAPFIRRLAAGLVDRRLDNHFGQDFQITLRR